jgi:hypothetical protein
MTREEIERRMDELAREYLETHDQKIIEELYKRREVVETQFLHSELPVAIHLTFAP